MCCGRQYLSVFTDDAIIDYSSSGGAKGTRDKVAGWMKTTFRMFSRSQHMISNFRFEIDELNKELLKEAVVPRAPRPVMTSLRGPREVRYIHDVLSLSLYI